MFTHVGMAAVHTEHRRQTLLAEAKQYRLAKLATARRRAAQRAADERLRRIVEGADPGPELHDDAAAEVGAFAAGKADANCR